MLSDVPCRLKEYIHVACHYDFWVSCPVMSIRPHIAFHHEKCLCHRVDFSGLDPYVTLWSKLFSGTCTLVCTCPYISYYRHVKQHRSLIYQPRNRAHVIGSSLHVIMAYFLFSNDNTYVIKLQRISSLNFVI